MKKYLAEKNFLRKEGWSMKKRKRIDIDKKWFQLNYNKKDWSNFALF